MKAFPPVLFLAAASVMGQTISLPPAPNGITPTIIISPQPHGAAWTANDGLGNTTAGQYYDQRSGAAVTFNPAPVCQTSRTSVIPVTPVIYNQPEAPVVNVAPVLIPVPVPEAPSSRMPAGYQPMPESYYRYCEKNLGIRKGDWIRPETKAKLIELWKSGRDF